MHDNLRYIVENQNMHNKLSNWWTNWLQMNIYNYVEQKEGENKKLVKKAA